MATPEPPPSNSIRWLYKQSRSYLDLLVPPALSRHNLNNYLSFVMTMFIAFGVTFEMPVVVVMLTRTGVVSVAKLQQIRPYVIVGAFVIAAAVTPPDVFSQLILAVPLIVPMRRG